MKTVLLSLLLLLNFSCSHKEHNGHKEGHHGHHHRFDDAEKWAKVFEDKKRDSWQRPARVIKEVGIKSNSLVADIGSATGYFPVRISKVANRGRVWGVDIEPNMVNFLNRRAKKERLSNVFSILGTFDDPLIPEPVDFIFIVDTYHHISKRLTYFKNLKSYLRKNGKVVIIDFRKGELPFGPKDAMKLSNATVISEMKEAGYKLDRDLDFLKYQYLLVFK
jgi:SAM-dependent methyltransferase